MTAEHFDVLIIGASLSGVGAAHHLQTRCPNQLYAILDASFVRRVLHLLENRRPVGDGLRLLPRLK